MEFDDFLQAVTEQPAESKSPQAAFDRVTVLGGSSDAQLLAALCLANGASVRLFSAYASELESISKGIALNGNGPVGRYHATTAAADSGSNPSSDNRSIVTTSSLDHCLQDAELIFLTGPIHKQRTYAMVLADHLQDGQVLCLPNARTFGALEVKWLLQSGGCRADISIAEMQGLPYFYDVTGGALDLQPAAAVGLSCVPAARTGTVVNALSALLPQLTACNSVLHSSFADSSALVELPALLVGGPALSKGGPSIPMGGTSLPENESFYNLLGEQQLSLASQLYDERTEVARRYGIRDLPDFDTSLTLYAGAEKGDGRRFVPPQATATAAIRDAVTGSLAPLLDAARIAGVSTPASSAMVTLACTVLGTDISASGRRLQNLGITDESFDGVYARLSGLSKHGAMHGTQYHAQRHAQHGSQRGSQRGSNTGGSA
jgi:hypothetical protein